MQTQSLLPSSQIERDNATKATSLLNKLPRRLLVLREDSLTFTPRPIKAAQQDSLSHSGLSSPNTSETSEASSSSSADVDQLHFWSQKSEHVISPLPSPPAAPSPPKNQFNPRASPFVTTQTDSAVATGPNSPSSIVSLVNAAIRGSHMQRPKQFLRRITSAPMEPVPEERLPGSSFNIRPTLSSEGPDTIGRFSRGKFAPLQPDAKASPKRNVVRGVVVTHSPAELHKLFQSPAETVVCEIKIPTIATTTSSKTDGGKTMYRIKAGWHVPEEHFPFSPRAEAVVKKPNPEELPAMTATSPSFCGIFSRFFQRFGQSQW